MPRPRPSFPFKGVFRIPLLICLFHHTIFALTALPAAGIPYTLEPNGIICSQYFGAPLLEDCQNAILEYESMRDGDPYAFFASVIGDADETNATLPLPWVFRNGTCVLAISIVSGGRNNVAESVLSGIAQAVAPTCASLSAPQGGWGAYADIAVIIASKDSNYSTAAWSNTTTPPPPSSSSASPSQSSGVSGASELAYFRGSFWASNTDAVDPTILPGYEITDQWQFPTSVYQPYETFEIASCGKREHVREEAITGVGGSGGGGEEMCVVGGFDGDDDAQREYCSG
ncbi:MAG: hypothetical protein Q9207_005705 [Kuettlingeria erythrocarpa]